jgi:hypothetical protein
MLLFTNSSASHKRMIIQVILLFVKRTATSTQT